MHRAPAVPTRPRSRARPVRRPRTWLGAILLFLVCSFAAAQECTYESEPNDQAATATVLTGTGPDAIAPANLSTVSGACLSGTLGSGTLGSGTLGSGTLGSGTLGSGDVDVYSWTATEADAGHRWRLELEGLDGQRLELAFAVAPAGAAAGDAVEVMRLAAGGGVGESSIEFLVVDGGTYTLTVTGGQGEYVARLRPVSALRYGIADERFDEHSATRRLDAPFGTYALAAGELTQPFRVPPELSDFEWDVDVWTALGSSATFSIAGPSGVVAGGSTDADGRARAHDLTLPAGEYTLTVTPSADAATTVRFALKAAGRPLGGAAVEPNDDWTTAGLVRPGDRVTGTLSRSDVFRLEVDAAAASDPLDIVLDSAQDVRFGVSDEWGRQLRDSRPGDALGLTLAAGAYRVVVDGPTGAAYTLSVATGTRRSPDGEPNDSLPAATDLVLGTAVQGEFSGRDIDTFGFDVVGAAGLYGVRLEAATGEWLRLLDPEGGVLAEARGDGVLRLDDLLLMPGRHHVAVRGTGEGYSLLVAPVDAVPPAGILEIEPNDDASRAIRLEPGAVHVGRLTGGSDDYYRFHLAADQDVRIAVTAAEDSEAIRVYVDDLGATLSLDQGTGVTTVVERRFLAGDHTVSLRGPQQESDGYYRLSLTLLGALERPVDAEPNDDRESAGLLPAELRFSGRVGERSGDYDMFLLPRFPSPTTVTVTATAVGSFSLDFPGEVTATVTQRGDAATARPWIAEVPPGGDVWLRLWGETAYELEVEFGAEPDPSRLLPPRTGETLSVELASAADTVAAFWHEGQTVTLTATVRNEAATTQEVALVTSVNNAAVVVDAPASVSVGPGQSVTVPLAAHLPSELRDDLPLRFEIGVSSDVDAAATATSVAALCEAPAVGAAAYWPLPASLLGRTNVLWSGLGSQPIGSSGFARRDLELVDGRTGPATAGYLGPDNQPTYQLAGSGPVTLVGTVLNPQVGNAVSDQVRSFRIETSLDGVSFSTALEGELASARIEQAFEFAAPIRARYARLSVVDSQGGSDRAYLGEWKLIAVEAPFTNALVSDPAVGGHVVWSVPFTSDHGRFLLTTGDSPRTIDVRDTGRFEFVVGFRDGRAGQIERLTWIDSAGAAARNDAEQLADVVQVAVSMSGGAGPWQELAPWTLARSADGSATVTLPEPVWARYVRFTVTPAEGVRGLYLPDAVQVYERAVSDEYPSLLGEYGNATRRAVYELLEAGAGSAQPSAVDAGDTRQQATPLAGGEVASGTVAVAHDVDWYRLTVPPGSNHLEVRLTGDPAIGYRYELQDDSGTRLGVEERQVGDGVVLSSYVDPGDYFLLIEEPRRSVVFAWDTSGSVSRYLPITYNSLARFAADVNAEREAVQLLAFNDPNPIWLLPFWSSDTVRVQRAIVEFDRQADSSNSETSLLAATRALADREGTRAILLMTDAESPGDRLTPELWQAFEAVRPRLFTFEISSSGNDYAQDLMQDWADVNGGVYTLATGVGDFDAGFSRASCVLRRPKAYTAEVTATYVEPPGPGTLVVTRVPGAAQPAVEVIFDASGSMGRELPSGEQRITAAKRALSALVSDVLPDGTPFALRAFGHIAPSSCETRLDIPLAPLDRAQAASAVAAIEPKLLSQTPLAASLAAVADDLAGATGGRTVVLITDGVESCKGDPAAAVAGLRASGVQVDIAIVSLALEPEALATFRALAEAIGASYVDVSSYEELSASLDDALNPEFEVIDASGAVVARGRVGTDGVQLPMGVYTVRVMGEEHTGVRVPGDARVSLAVGAK